MDDTNADILKEEHKITLLQMKRAKDIDSLLLECRVGGLRHAWKNVAPEVPTRPNGVLARMQKCVRCGATKEWGESKRYGVVLHPPRYRHPQGYLMPRDPAMKGGLSSKAVRLLLAQSHTDLPKAEDVISEWEARDE